MVVLIGGYSCTGKTLMSHNLLVKYKIPYYSIDHIKMGIYRSDKNCGFSPTDSDELIAEKLWPIIKGIIMTSIENDQNIIIEGCYILPQFIKEFEQQYSKQIIPVFIGFSKEYIENKFESNIIACRNIIETRKYEEERSIQKFILENRRVKMLCNSNKVEYFEIEEDYNEEILKVYDYIEIKNKQLLT